MSQCVVVADDLTGGNATGVLLRKMNYQANTVLNLAAVDPDRPELSYHVRTKVEVSLKYRGYIEKQLAQIEKFKKLEGQTIPDGIDYMSMEVLRNEAREKLTDIRPESVGQASRISGASPADINVLLVQLERMRRKH